MEEQGLYQLFEGMMKALIMEKPKDPIDFLLGKLQQPEGKYYFCSQPYNGRFHS